MITNPHTTDSYPLTTDFLKFRKSIKAYYRRNTDLLPTKYRLITKKSNFFSVLVGISLVIGIYPFGKKLYPIVQNKYVKYVLFNIPRK